MQRFILLALALGIAHGSSGVLAQPDPTFPMENHYKVYFVQPNPSRSGNLVLEDQFGTHESTLGQTLFNFANPVQKNGSTVYRPELHYTWWFMPSNVQDPIRTVQFENQFGRQTWTIGQAPYLLVPSAKSLPPQGPPPPLPPNSANHYLCYQALGPAENVPVTLLDQFGQTMHVATLPAYFCNPCVKRLDTGEVFPIVDAEAHLACYEVDPRTPAFRDLIAVDQFGTWQLLAREVNYLCVPSNKLNPVGVNRETWGRVKKLYRD